MRHRSRGRLLMWLDSTPSSGVLWVSGFCENLRPRDCSQDWILYEVELVLEGAGAGSRYKPAWCFQSSIVLRVEQALWINSFWSFHHLYVDEKPGWEGESSRTWAGLCILGLLLCISTVRGIFEINRPIYIYEMSFARFKSNGLKANKYCIYGVQISVTKTSLSLGHLTSISSNAAVLSHINVFVLHDSAGHWNFIQESFSWATELLYLSEGWQDCHLISS